MKRNPQLAKLLSDAERSEAAGRLAEAVKLLKRALIIEPAEPILLILGSLQRKTKEFREAIKQFDKAIAIKPERALTYIMKAQCLIALKRYKEARLVFLRSLKVEARADTFVQLGSVCEKLADEKGARRYYEAALKIDKWYEEAHFNLARLLRKRDPQKALSHLRTAIRIDPNYVVAHAELGVVLIELKRYAAAEKALRKAIALDDKSFWNHLYLANLLWTRGRPEEAEDEYQAAMRLDDSDFSRRCFLNFKEATRKAEI